MSAAAIERVSPLPGQALKVVHDWDGYNADITLSPTNNIDEAKLLTSAIEGEEDMHKVVLDIDFPAQLLPSSTPGHFPLLIDKKVAWTDYVILLESLEVAGIVESGYVHASIERGFTGVRLPWVKKSDAKPTPKCVGCHKRASRIPEYVELAKSEGYTSAAEAVRKEEGTYNSVNGHFFCTECYLKAGQPLGVAA